MNGEIILVNCPTAFEHSVTLSAIACSIAISSLRVFSTQLMRTSASLSLNRIESHEGLSGLDED